MHLGAAPIPFLGYLISHDSVRPLMRNQRKFQRRHRRLIKWNERESIIHKHNLSYHAWADLSELSPAVK